MQGTLVMSFYLRLIPEKSNYEIFENFKIFKILEFSKIVPFGPSLDQSELF